MRKELSGTRAFTLIELIVVIAVIGILVLLAVPKFLGYTKDAKLAQIKNDVKAYEVAIEAERMKVERNGSEDIFISDNHKVEKNELLKYVDENSLFHKRGLAKSTDLDNDDYYTVDKSFNLVKSKLNGQFYLAKGGKVFYLEENLPNKPIEPENPSEPEDNDKPTDPNEPGESEGPTDKDLGMEDDFEWVPNGNGYIGINGEKGYFKYIGKGKEEIEIPHVIQGVKMTSYYHMFHDPKGKVGEDVSKVISTKNHS